MQIQEIQIDDLKEYENNPRQNDNAVEAVAESIKQFGFKVPIVVDTDNVIVAGHTRAKAARMLGMTAVPCIVASDLTHEQICAFRIADNKTAEIAEWDFDKLELELAKITEIDMQDFGFDMVEFDEETEIIEDIAPAVDEVNEPVTKRGDVWQLGNHRLMCGDSTSESDLIKLMSGNAADLVVTDPPYNMGYMGAGGNSKTKHDKILNDKMSDTDFDEFLQKVYKNIYAGLKENASFYVFYKELGKGVFLTALEKAGLTFKQELIWVKNQLVLGGSKYQNMYEPCLFGCKGDKVGNWYAGRKERSVIESVDLMNEIELRTALKELQETITTDIVRENKPLKNDLHPTMKPVKLLAKFIKNSSAKNDIVLDVFGGSGSTLVACEQLDRACYTMELDERYCDVIIKRWKMQTGGKAVLVSRQQNNATS